MDYDRHRRMHVTRHAFVAVFTLSLAACDGAAKPGANATGEGHTMTSPSAATSDTAARPGLESGPSTASAATDTTGGASSTSPPPTAGASASASGTAAVPSPTGAEAQTTDRGAAKNDAAYSAWLEASNPYHVGKPGTVRAVVVAGKGYKCNDKYPYKFKLDAPPAGLSYPETTARGIQYGAERSVLPVTILPQAPGTHTVSGTFSLSVCTEATCKIQREPLSVAVRVEP
jgi:hypothetical protein